MNDKSYWDQGNHGNRIVFLGDSRIRQLYFGFVNLLSDEPQEPAKYHSDLYFKQKDLRVDVVSFKDTVKSVLRDHYHERSPVFF